MTTVFISLLALRAERHAQIDADPLTVAADGEQILLGGMDQLRTGLPEAAV